MRRSFILSVLVLLLIFSCAAAPALSAPPDEREIAAYYAARQPLFVRKKQYRICHVLAGSEKELESLLRSYHALREKSGDPRAAMLALIDDISGREAVKQWGDLGWISAEKLPAGIRDAVLSMRKSGELRAFASPLGYHLVMLMHVREARRYSLEEVKAYIVAQLEREKTAGKKKNMALIPGGVFTLGYDKAEIRDRHRIWEACVRPFVAMRNPGWNKSIRNTYHTARLEPFYIDRSEVTAGEYREFLEATGRRAQETYSGDVLPATGISWEEADAFCRWKGKRLPTQDEWETAARGKERRLYPWGNQPPDGTRGNFADVNAPVPWKNARFNDGYALLAPVNSYPAGRTPEGVYDLGGNAKEWTASAGRDRNTAVVKGGSFENAYDDMQPSDRRDYDRKTTAASLGFRCACDGKDE